MSIRELLFEACQICKIKMSLCFSVFINLERKKEVALDKSRNLIGARAEVLKGDAANDEEDILVATFTKQIVTDDSLHDVDIGFFNFRNTNFK